MKCACDQCDRRVSDEGELCAFCGGRCFPTVNGRVTVASVAHRVQQHASKRVAEPPPPPPPQAAVPAAPSPFVEALNGAAKAFYKEAQKELIPNLVKLAEREAKKRLGSL